MMKCERDTLPGLSRHSPLPNMVNLVPKAGSEGKFRLIHDLSYPYNDQSVNACILQENASVKYQSIDDVIDMALEIGTSTIASCIDVRSAFRNLPLLVLVIFVLSFTLIRLIYINTSVPFGLASSCAIFEKVANILQWIVMNETNARWISHYLNDYILLAKCLSDLCILMKQFKHIMSWIGMPNCTSKNAGTFWNHRIPWINSKHSATTHSNTWKEEKKLFGTIGPITEFTFSPQEGHGQANPKTFRSSQSLSILCHFFSCCTVWEFSRQIHFDWWKNLWVVLPQVSYKMVFGVAHDGLRGAERI